MIANMNRHRTSNPQGTQSPLLLMFVFCYLFGIAVNTYAQVSLPSSGDIGTVAGNGTEGYSGDGSAATSAELNIPYGVAVDSSGNIYIADYQQAVIRKVTASTGDISTIAGGGSGCVGETDSFGDGCAATNAILYAPEDVALDGSGNIYIADTGHQMIREIAVSTGTITAFAGNGTLGNSGDNGPATSAELFEPVDVTVDSSGNVYIVVSGAIREVLASNGYIQLIAGRGSGCVGETDSSGDGCLATDASLRLPEGVAVDSSGNVFVAEYGNDVIREIVASTGIINAVAGNYTSGYSGDGSAATSAQLNEPYHVAVDSSSNVYFSDYGNQVIRKISSSTGYISTVAGNGTAGYSGDGGVATSAELYNAIGVAVDSSKNIYIADGYNSRIRAVGH
jgi:streptogramin lyase